ncbi:MAG: glycosyltransferase family 39 protein [Anaerolineae bacterium]|nr:glycosyltransferase family 39 protein [Anaerolineae bacterium]
MKRLLYAILAAYLVLATVYSVVTPIFEAADELWHYPMVQYLATHGLALPPQEPGIITAWRQEGSQPPLYYLIAAVLTSPVDTSDLDVIRRQNPHADIGVIRPDGNANMIVHHADLEAFPWRGTVLAVHIARLFSVLLGLGTVIVTFRLGRELFPQRPEVALGAAALNACLPMFLFISGSVNNDNLSNLLGNLLLLLIVLLLKAERPPRYQLYALIGIITGASLLAKLNLGLLIPLVALALVVVSLRFRDWRPLVVGGLISGTLTIVIAGWWYLRNFQLYGDPTGLNNFLDIVGRRAIPANAAQLWAERDSFAQAFWGFFGGVNVALPDAVYLIFNLISGVGIVSAALFMLYRLTSWRTWRLGGSKYLPHLVSVLWIAITLISYLRWTAETWASQGRLVFGALSPILVLIALGLTWWLPRRARPLLIGATALVFAVVAVYAPFGVIAPAYALPAPAESGAARATFNAPDDGAVALLDARISTATVQPDEYVLLEIDWRIETPLQRNWSLFVHLVTPDGVIVGQRDVYPGGGTLATGDLAAGYTWRNPVAVVVPSSAYAPETLRVVVGWSDLATGERLALPDGSNVFEIGTVGLQPRASDLNIPNPLSVNFGDRLELVGYALSDLTPAAGASFDLTLYWRAIQPVSQDYTVFAHVIDPATTTIYAGSDSAPGGSATSTWTPSEIVEDRHTLTVNPDAPPGIYEVEIGLYRSPGDGTFPRLRIVTADGGMANDYTYLSRVRVLPREDE